MIYIKKLCKSFEGVKVLDELHMHVSKGSIYGFVGANGAGKSTTFKIMGGLLNASSGEVLIDGVDACIHSNQMKDNIGYMPDQFGVYDNVKVIEYIRFFASLYGLDGLEYDKYLHEILDKVGLLDKSELYVDHLSRGMKQRLGLARAMVHNPKVFILDEPASGLDPRNREQFKEILKGLQEDEKTVIISSHILSELSQMCTHIGIINEGKMVLEGDIEDITNQVDIINPLKITIYDEVERAVRYLNKVSLVRKLSINQNELVMQFLGDKREEALLLREMIKEGILVSSYVREQGELESLFMQLTEGQKE
jgi:ABC-2 type transport system ATP-binding protein